MNTQRKLIFLSVFFELCVSQWQCVIWTRIINTIYVFWSVINLSKFNLLILQFITSFFQITSPNSIVQKFPSGKFFNIRQYLPNLLYLSWWIWTLSLGGIIPSRERSRLSSTVSFDTLKKTGFTSQGIWYLQPKVSRQILWY